jgi:hypothetical protein
MLDLSEVTWNADINVSHTGEEALSGNTEQTILSDFFK